MKLTFILCFSVTLSISASTYSQKTQLTLNLKNVRLEEVLDAIRNQSEFSFWYKNNEINLNKLITIHAEKENIETILTEALKEQGLSFTVIDKHIVLYKPDDTVISGSTIQQQKITGTVTDAGTNEPLVGVSIQVDGTTTGTVTDLNGKYTISAPANAVLVFSYLGYVSQKVTYTGQATLDIKLAADVKSLQEVVVVGYGTAQKKNVIGSVDQVKASAIENRPVTNLTQALQGAAPGLVIQQKNMEPGAALNLNIRGVSTLNNNAPLVVIDGIISNDNSDLNLLNPNDIESISVLKDAGSAAIYGSRSANGVILVTTKQGKKNSRTVVNFNALTGIQAPHVLFKPVAGYENAILRDQALVNSGAAPVYSPQDIQAMKEKGDNEWFLNSILQNSLQQNYNLSISGGSDHSTYMISGGYLNQGSNFVGPDYGLKRYNFRMNMTNEYGRLKLTTLMGYTRTNIKTHASNSSTLIIDASRLPAYYYYKLKDDQGRYLLNDVLSEFNPLGILEQGGYKASDYDNFTGNVTAELNIFKGLTLKGMFGGDIKANHDLLIVKKVDFYSSPEAVTPSGSAGADRNTQDGNNKAVFLNTNLMLDYSRTFNNHHVSALIGVSNEYLKQQQNWLFKKYTDPDLNIPVTSTIIETTSANTPEQTLERGLNSAFGRLGYSYNDKYLFEADFRYDGSSKFSKDKRWGFFPSVSGGWRMSEENFLSGYKEHIGDIKLRASYGILGNQNVGDYQYQTTYNIFTNAYGFNNTAVAGTGFQFANTDLRWEKAATFDLGADLTFFNNKISVSADYFDKLTSDILLQPEIPSTFGGAFGSYNAGKVRNQGWEVNFNYRAKTGEFTHDLNFNLADSWNEVVDYLGRETISSYDNMQKITREGLPIGSYYGYKTDGLFQNLDEVTNDPKPIGATVVPGDVRYKDKNGDGVIDDKDRYVLGNAFPRYTFGLNYSVAWKNFDLNMLVQGVGKRNMFIRGELVEPFHASYSYVMYQHQLDFWTPTNPDARFPRLSAPNSASDVNNYGKSSDLFIFNGAYLRMKNIQIGYTIPAAVSHKIGIQKCRLYLTAQNLFTISGVSFIDPESTEFDSNMVNGGANSGRNYPTLVYYGFGIDLNF